MFFDLNDKKVFLTGSTGTIGSSIASVFNKSGATLICTSTSKSKLTKLKEIIGEKHFFYLLDLKNNKEFDNRLNEIIKAHNDINVIINNAGYNDDNLSLRMKEEQWNDVININLTSNYKIIKKIAPSMIKAKYGRIIGISSVVAFTGNKGQSNYSASKSGMIGLYKSLALEYASRGITVNMIAPGFIESNMTDKLDSQQKEKIIINIPLKKLGKSEDIAYGALYLASKESGFITGHTIHINGGMLMI
tara:strand:- start:440 stop:1180 length:741 start_codon:yes stop_codon:yes gene_type:complete